MEKIKTLLCFLSEINFTEIINCSFIERLGCVKKWLVIEFEQYNISKLLYVLIRVDEFLNAILIDSLEDPVKKITPYERILYLYLILNILLEMLVRL